MKAKNRILTKKKILAAICAASMCLWSLSGCSGSDSNDDSENSSDTSADMAYLVSCSLSGTVTSVSESEITLSVSLGTGNFGGMGGDSMDMQMNAGGDAPSDMPSDNGEGGETPPDMPSDNGEGGEAPSDVPSDNGEGGETPSDMPSDNGEGGEAPSDVPSDNGEGGEAPSDVPSDNGEGGEAPSDVPSDNGEGGEAPSDVPSDSGEDGEATSDVPSDNGEGGETDMSGSAYTVVLTVTDESIISDTDGNSLALSDIEVGSTVTFTVDENGELTEIIVGETSDSSGQMPGGGMSSGGVDSYDSVVTYSEDGSYTSEEYTSTGADENAVLVTAGEVSISNSVVSRISSDSTGGDNSSFYGVGASLLVTGGTLLLSDSEITSDSAGGAGVFSYGDGVAYVSNTEITTAQDTSGGIHVAGGGTLYAWNLTVSTSGESSAAIRSDRGSGVMVVDGGSYQSNGTGSPAIYSTADITVNDAQLTATSSEAICIEGLNSIRLFNCDLSGNMLDSSQNDCTWNVIVYQSMSGDSEVGNGSFTMIGGSLAAGNGGMFYTTNTESTFLISGVDISYASESDFFLKCTGNSNQRGWGSSGQNGADCNFTARDQEMEGAVIYDSISSLEFYILDGSVLTGYFIDDESNAGSGGNGECNVYIDSTSSFIVTADSQITNLYCQGSIVDESGNLVSIVGTDGTVYVDGTSEYTVTVESYSESVDTSGASELVSFEDYSVENPF